MLEINDHPLGFECDFGPEMKDHNDSDTARVVVWTSLKIATLLLSLLKGLEVHLSIQFSSPMAFTTFLHVKNFLISLDNSVFPPSFLRIVDWSWQLNFTTKFFADGWLKFLCGFLAVLQNSKVEEKHPRFDQHISHARWLSGSISNLSTRSCRPWRPLNQWFMPMMRQHQKPSICTISHKNSGMTGCGLDGKLLERTWYDAIFASYHRKENSIPNWISFNWI